MRLIKGQQLVGFSHCVAACERLRGASETGRAKPVVDKSVQDPPALEQWGGFSS